MTYLPWIGTRTPPTTVVKTAPRCVLCRERPGARYVDAAYAVCPECGNEFVPVHAGGEVVA